MKRTKILALFLSLIPCGALAAGLTPDVPSARPAGTTVTWTVTGEDAPDEAYRLSVKRGGEPLRVIADYSRSNVFEWTPIDSGDYFVLASVINLDSGETTFAGMNYVIGPRVPQAQAGPVVTPTEHPLVAVYSAPGCPAGASMFVSFASATGDPLTESMTNQKACRGLDLTMNFYIGGMREATTYVMFHSVVDGDGIVVSSGPPIPFRTGDLPPDFPIAENFVAVPPAGGNSAEKFLLISAVIGNEAESVPAYPFAVDLSGQVVWYRFLVMGQITPRPTGNGHFMAILSDNSTEIHDQILLEFDLAGRTVRSTNVLALSLQLESLGLNRINSIHHETRPLPGGRTAIMASVEKIIPGTEGPVDILGDMILILDQNFQVEWAWNPFAHLDVNRTATLGDTCTHGQTGCPPLFLDEMANDWMHANAIAYSPDDGNLLLSIRSQDWVVKIDYRDGEGSGDILWRLGPEGDFTIDSADPFPWNSHQHDINLAAPDVLTLYDNGNTRCDPEPEDCFSRGQVYQIDETTMTASHLLNLELPEFAEAAGSAQPLLNGNYHFNSGLINGFGAPGNNSLEITPEGEIVYSLKANIFSYRSHRMMDLYSLPAAWGVSPE